MPRLTITLGLHLDGPASRALAQRAGEIAVGPLALLGLLETRLGLGAEQPSRAERIVQYRDCLARVDSPARFYHASFAADALGSASTLLAWRDLWLLEDWNGEAPPGASRRLADLAEVEALARRTVAPSPGERLARVRCRLEQGQPPLGELRLVDPVAVFPRRWQSVLALLPLTLVKSDASAGEGFLGILQGKLRRAAAGERPDPVDWQDDGSVTVVQGETRGLAASWLARRIDPTTPTLIVSGGEGACLDEHLLAAGRPCPGLREASVFRPALQLLPLALEILWAPLDFLGLLQFLTHPLCPLPDHARRQLAAKVADAPGIGGRLWEKALADIDRYYGDAAPGVRETIRRWVEPPRFRHDEGAPVALVLARVRQLAAFFRARRDGDDLAQRLSAAAGLDQCHACAGSLAALQAQGVDTLRPRQLQRLLSQASGSDDPPRPAEVGACRGLTHPGAAVEAVGDVFWWQLVMPALPASPPWSAAELRSLGEAGMLLPGSEARLAQAAREWLRPILAARKHLTLVLPPQGEEVHPVWQMIESVVRRPVVQALEALLLRPSGSTRPVICAPLPAPKRWWRLPDDLPVRLRPKESFSSLELLLFNPWHWLLRYPAALRPSRSVSLGGDFRMFGRLAHGLVERYYRRPDALTMGDAEFHAWFGPAFARLIGEEGASLLVAGRGAEREGFRQRLSQSMLGLRRQLLGAGVVRVEPEREVSGSFAGGLLGGFADLVMHQRDGGCAIVDLKWSGARRLAQKLHQNRHLQLAIYAELLRQENGAWPAVAYYVLDRARCLAAEEGSFPDAEVVASASGENTAELWQRFVETWKWRREQVEAGRFELVLERIAESGDSLPPGNALAGEYLNPSVNDYRTLAGWEN